MIKIGQEFGNFLIKAEIGRGGMGTIYYAIDTMLNREVALKLIHPQYTGQAELMERFKIEAMTQARMNHPNIVMIFSFSRIEENYVIAMEYVDGRSLKELLLERKKIPLPESLDYLGQIIRALDYAHSLQVIHRDIKPANILVSRDGRIKISDFGIAKVFGTQGLTKTGMLIGTPWYTSPEQILGKDIDYRSDLYSLGITFYEMVTGRVPFHDDTNSEFQIQKAHLETPPPRPSVFNPEIDLQLEKFMLRALEKKVEKRFASARDMVEDLEELRKGVHEATALSTDRGMLEKKKRLPVFSRAGLAWGGAALLTVFALLWFFFLRPAPPESAESSRDSLVIQETTPVQVGEVAGGESGIEGLSDPGFSTREDATKESGSVSGDADKQLPPRMDDPDQVRLDSRPGQMTAAQIDRQMVRIKNMINQRDWISAEELGREILGVSRVPAAVAAMGVIRFYRGDYVEAQMLMREALDLRQSVPVPVLHVHEPERGTCRGVLFLKKGVVVFSSATDPGHSFLWEAVQPGGLQVTSGVGPGLSFDFFLQGKNHNRKLIFQGGGNDREKSLFLADFIKNNVL